MLYEVITAIVRLCRALQQIGYRHPALGLCSLVIGEDTSMRALLGTVRDDLSGELTVNLATLKLDSHGCQLGIDVRVPVSFSRQEYHQMMRAAVDRLGWRYEEFDHLDVITSYSIHYTKLYECFQESCPYSTPLGL